MNLGGGEKTENRKLSTLLDELRTIFAQNVISNNDLDFLNGKIEEYSPMFSFY